MECDTARCAHVEGFLQRSTVATVPPLDYCTCTTPSETRGFAFLRFVSTGAAGCFVCVHYGNFGHCKRARTADFAAVVSVFGMAVVDAGPSSDSRGSVVEFWLAFGSVHATREMPHASRFTHSR